MTNTLEFLLDLLKLIIAGSAVFFIAYYTLRSEFDRRAQLRILEFKKETSGTTLPLRLQAYERLALLIERINPASLFVRSHVPGASVLEMQRILVSEIQNEFQHNVTQQVYTSDLVWSVVRRLKEDTISLINNSAQGLSAEDNAFALSKTVLTHLSTLETNPYDAALNLIRSEIRELF